MDSYHNTKNYLFSVNWCFATLHNYMYKQWQYWSTPLDLILKYTKIYETSTSVSKKKSQAIVYDHFRIAICLLIYRSCQYVRMYKMYHNIL